MQNGICQSLVLCPLLAQHHRQANTPHDNRGNKRHPAKQRHKPHAPGNGHIPAGHPFKQPLHSPALIGGNQPVGQILVKITSPLILWCGEIIGNGNHAQKITRQPKGGNSSPHQSHRQNRPHFGTRQRPGSLPSTRDCIAQSQHHIRREQRDRKMCDIHTRGVGDILDIRIPPNHQQRECQPHNDRPRSHTFPRGECIAINYSLPKCHRIVFPPILYSREYPSQT